MSVHERRFVPKGTLLIEEGEQGSSAYRLLSGKVEVFSGHDGKETVLATLSASEKKQNERLEELQDNFYLSFLCPKCKMDLSKRSWNYWKNQEKCPKCKCDWVAP